MIVPAGFEPLAPQDAVMAQLAPLYARRDGDHVAIGFHVAAHHRNPHGICHGGVLATIVDLQLGMNILTMSGSAGPTISLTIDYLAAAIPGAWIEGRTEVLRMTRGLGFVQCMLIADGEPVVRASGIFKRAFQPTNHAP